MAKYHDGAVSGSRRVVNVLLTVLLAALCVVWLYPVLLILINSLKDELAISTATVFELPTQATFAGLHNYAYGITQLNFLQSFGYSATITITSVVLILLCCSMCGWYITRVSSMISKAMYLLCVFSMVVPFQMVMFTLSKTADTLRLNTPFNICVIYLGFGAGLAVFMFTGFMKSVPIAIEEAAMIDGASRLQRIWHINLTGILPTITIMLILQVGNLMTVGFEKAFLMQNPLNLETSEIISTFVYKMGLNYRQYSYSTAIGLFNSVINMILLVSVNTIAGRLSETSLW